MLAFSALADLGVTALRRLKMLEDENSRSKRIVADLTVDKQVPQGSSEKALRAAKRRELAAWIQERFRVSVRRSLPTGTAASVGLVRQVRRAREIFGSTGGKPQR